MTHKLKTEMFSQKIEYSDGVFFWPLTRYLVLLAFTLNSANIKPAVQKLRVLR